MKRLLVSLFVAVLLVAPSLLAQTVIRVDAGAGRHAIDPRVYGVNFASTAQLRELNVPVNRSGGNATTRYNWMQNASNHASDWYFESLEEGPDTPGESVDTFISDTRAAGAKPMVTIPMIGWVATLGPNHERLSSFSIAKYGAQQDADWQWFPDAGNGVYPDGTPITGNDPTDANINSDAAFQQAWVQHMKSRWGSGGTYLLDNEHSLWQETHRDVKPVGATMDEIASRMIEYSRAIKTADPAAIVAGPEEWGWLGYLMSGYDQQWASENYDWSNTPDRIAHGGSDYMPWLLQTIRAEETRSGQRLLDIFTLHFYPQGGEFSDDTSQAMQLRRNRSTRALWDPNYLDQTWINDYVKLIPRMRQWVNAYAPGIKIGLTEYSWGADNHMNGATAQADVLGILGRERMNVATRWVVPPTGSPAYLAIRMYRNYDGMRSTFGDTSVSAIAPNVDNVAAFASKRTRDGALTVMLVNKQLSTSAAVVVKVANFTAGTSAQRWQLAAGAIQKKANVAKSSSSFSLTLPAQSVTLLVIPKG